MTTQHGYIIEALDFSLKRQLDRREFAVRSDPVRLRAPSGSNHIPDLCVVSRATARRVLAQRSRRLEVYSEPLPLVVEVWSQSTGDYDVTEKLEEYKRREDQEIWLIHPYERTLTAWRRQPDGTYTETVFRGGAVQPVALPNVSIDLATLFSSRT